MLVYPLWLPPIVVFLATIVSGLTAFGDGIILLAIWTILASIGVLDAGNPDLLTTVVSLGAFMAIAPLPYLVWVAWGEMKDVFWWGLTSGLLCGALVPVGVYLLLAADVTVLKLCVGSLFLAFGVVKLWQSVAAEARERRKRRGLLPSPPLAAPPPPPPPDAQVEITRYQFLTHGAAEGAPPTVDAATEQGEAAPPPSDSPALSCTLRWQRAFPIISAGHSVKYTAAVLWLGGVGAGVLGGMLGVGGPPQIMSFALLRLDKGTQRGIRVLVGLIAALFRIVSLVTTPHTVYRLADWPVYVCVTLAAVAGTALGTYFRARVSTEAILRSLYILLILCPLTLFDITSHVLHAIVFASCVCVYAAALAVVWCRPRLPCMPAYAQLEEHGV